MKQTPPYFIIDDRVYKLYKRGKEEDSPWWVRLQILGKRQGVSTATADPDQAVRIGTEIVKDALRGEWSKADSYVTERGKKFSTIGQILKLADPEYGKRLMELLEVTDQRDTKKLPVTVLTKALVRKFQAKCQGLKNPDYELQHEANGHANATLRHAKSAFSAKARASYERAGLSLPPLSEFLAVPELKEAKFRYSDDPLSRRQVAEIAKALPKLLKTAPLLHKEHLQVALTGAASERKKEHEGWLAQFATTVEQVRWHCGAVWLKKTGSLKLVAEKMGVSYTWALWHYGRIRSEDVHLTLEDL